MSRTQTAALKANSSVTTHRSPTSWIIVLLPL
jgi:hypothetical protein